MADHAIAESGAELRGLESFVADWSSDQEAFKTKNIEGAIQLDWPTIASKNAEWNDRFNKEVVAFVK